MMFLIIVFVFPHAVHNNGIQCAIQDPYANFARSSLPTRNWPIPQKIPLLGPVLSEDRSFKHPNKVVSSQDGTSRRRSKLLSELGFLNGFGSGNLLAAASSNLSPVLKFSKDSVTLNLSPSGYLTAYQEPYALLAYPYTFPYRLSGWYPFLNLVKLQQDLLNPFFQQSLGLVDNNKPNEPQAETEDVVYAEENETIDNNKFQDDRLECNNEDSVELKKSDYPNESRKEVAAVSKEVLEPIERDDQEDQSADNASETMKIDNTTKPGISTAESANETSTIDPSSANTTDAAGNQTESPQFLGYYGGSPQDVNHVVLTTETPLPKYQNLRYQQDEVALSLPFDRAPNFNTFDKYNYPDPPSNSFSSIDKDLQLFNTEDFNGLAYSFYNPPTLNGFRPIV